MDARGGLTVASIAATTNVVNSRAHPTTLWLCATFLCDQASVVVQQHVAEAGGDWRAQHRGNRIGDCIKGTTPDPLAVKPVVLDEANNRRLVGHGVVHEVLPGVRRDHKHRYPRAVATASLRVRSANSGKLRSSGTAKAGRGQAIGAGLRGVQDLSELMIVPAVGVVPVDDDCRARPIGQLRQEVDDVHDELLLVNGVRIAGVAFLIAGRFQEADLRVISSVNRVKEIMDVVLVISRVARPANRHWRSRTGMLPIGGGRVVLESLVMRNVVFLVYLR